MHINVIPSLKSCCINEFVNVYQVITRLALARTVTFFSKQPSYLEAADNYTILKKITCTMLER